MTSSRHYDTISGFYEYLTEKLHGGHRVEAVNLLHLQPGHSVLDAACGTGANLPLLHRTVGPDGAIVETDYSKGMLDQARRKAASSGWDNVTCVEADASVLSSDLVGRDSFDAAICMLGLTVIPNWERAFERIYGLVKPGGRFVIMDLYLADKPTSWVANRYYETIAKAHSTRKVWEPLQADATDFTMLDHSWFGGVARIVAGTKPTA